MDNELESIIRRVRGQYEVNDNDIMYLLYDKFMENPDSLSDNEVEFILWYRPNSSNAEFITEFQEGVRSFIETGIRSCNLVTYEYTYDDLKEIEKIAFALKVVKSITKTQPGQPLDTLDKVLNKIFDTEKLITELYCRATTNKLTKEDIEFLKGSWV